jgi:SAM-dependent methyltransferase
MTLAVLQSFDEIRQARHCLRTRGLSRLPPPWIERLLRWARLGRFLHGAFIKSWDVWKTAMFLEKELARDAAVVDLGAYQSEILAILHRLGFTQLHGVDRDARLPRQALHESIRYTVADFYATPLAAGSFAAVTAISAIEHGLDLQRLFAEVSRLLRPGGFFLASTDYWPDKIDTADNRMFGLSWTIFSAAELRAVLATAQTHGLEPVGPLEYAAAEPVIHYANRDYTFAWFALKKTA